MERNTLSILALLIGVASLLTCGGISYQSGDSSPQISLHASMAAVTSHPVNVTGQVVDMENFRIISDFVAVAVNNANGKRVQSDPFNNGDFIITLYVPGFADDNQTIDIQVLSLDQKTMYGNTSLVLANLNHTSSFSLLVTVANPPPNYNWLILIVAVFIFSLILAGYIVFTKWLVGQAVLRRADEIMIKRRMGEENFDENSLDETDDGDNEDNSVEDDKNDS